MREVTIIFFVNGFDMRVDIMPDQPLGAARDIALTETNNIGRPMNDWDIHNDEGVWLDPECIIEDLSLVDAARLFLNLKVGAGGGARLPTLEENLLARVVQLEKALLHAEAIISDLQDNLETERMRLAACGVAAMANTTTSHAQQLLTKDSPYYSASYSDVLRCVNTEMRYREALKEVAGNKGTYGIYSMMYSVDNAADVLEKGRGL